MAGLMALALCAAAARGDRVLVTAEDGGRCPAVDDEPVHAGDDVARRARAAVRGRRAWVFATPTEHGHLSVVGEHGPGEVGPVQSFAVRVAGLAINAELPVIVPGPADGSLGETALVGVPLPFADGRIGALVVAGRRSVLAQSPAAFKDLFALAGEAVVAADARVAVSI